VRVDAVTHGYDDLVAARDEIARALDPAAGGFTVEADVAGNTVVVRTESGDAAGTTAVAQAAARRGANRSPEQRAAVAEANGMVPDDAPAAGAAPPGNDVAAAVRVEPNAAIDIAPEATRRTFPPNAAGLSTAIAAGSRLTGCTTGFVIRIRGYGDFSSFAGHCGQVGHGVAIGPRLVGLIAGNTYFPYRRVTADAAIVSTSAGGFPSAPGIRTGVNGSRWRRLTAKLSNTQVSHGLRLCFDGITSDSSNCGPVVRANQWMCCDATGRSFFYSCIRYTSRPGDSGGPVFYPVGSDRAYAAGMVSSSVTVNGVTMTCFTTAHSLEYMLRGSILVSR
jgi:hypothetical protein